MPWIARGQVLPASDPRVQNNPDLFEEAPQGVVRRPAPKEGEVAAVAQVPFIAADGGWVVYGQRFYPYAQVVRENKPFFSFEYSDAGR